MTGDPRCLRAPLAERIAPVVLQNITTRYPYYDAHVVVDGEKPAGPESSHPAFCNSFDWHSSVHSHWTAIGLLEYFALGGDERPISASLRDAVVRNLSDSNCEAETRYLAMHSSYERPYGWAWALALAARAFTSETAAAKTVRTPLMSLARQVSANAVQWLKVMPGPVRHGVHSNTAFALAVMFDASSILGFAELEDMIGRQARLWFEVDRNYPQAWERNAYDFLSPGLSEADLMHRVIDRQAFQSWWRQFLPGGLHDVILDVVEVPDLNDGAVMHLHGLNLSRAAMLARIACALSPHDKQKETTDEMRRLIRQAQRLYESSVEAAYGDKYLATHWLPTFAWDAACSMDQTRSKLAL